MAMAKYFQRSLQFARLTVSNFIDPARLEWWPTANSMRHQKFSTSSICAMGSGGRAISTHATIDSIKEPSTLPSTRNSTPWLMLPTAPTSEIKEGEREVMEPTMAYKFYNLAEERVITVEKKCQEPDPNAYCVGSSYGWVAFINKRPADYDFFISNPITGRSIKLPSLRTLNICDEDSFWYVFKVVMSSPYPDAADCRILVQYQPDRSRCGLTPNSRAPPPPPLTRLAFCSPGCGDANWNILDSSDRVLEIVYSPSDERFFALDGISFQIESWDLCDISKPKRDRVVIEKEDLEPLLNSLRESRGVVQWLHEKKFYLKEFSITYKFYLVPDTSMPGQLYLINRILGYDTYDTLAVPPGSGLDVVPRIPHKTAKFEVYKLDGNGMRTGLKYMDSLGDRAFFIGLNGGFMLSAKDCPELKPNSIYFTDDLNHCPCNHSEDLPRRQFIDFEAKTFGGHDIGVYNYQDRTFEGCHYPVDIYECKRIQPNPVWFTPN